MPPRRSLYHLRLVSLRAARILWEAWQAARRLLTGASGGLPTRPACPTRTRVQGPRWLRLSGSVKLRRGMVNVRASWVDPRTLEGNY